MQVKGIFRTPRGYAAMVEATPIKLSYVIYPGEHFYDGMLVAIEESRLVFRKQTKWTDGRTVVAVENKPLVQPTAADQLTALREPQAAAPAVERRSPTLTNSSRRSRPSQPEPRSRRAAPAATRRNRAPTPSPPSRRENPKAPGASTTRPTVASSRLNSNGGKEPFKRAAPCGVHFDNMAVGLPRCAARALRVGSMEANPDER